jgi:hypothetical protein
VGAPRGMSHRRRAHGEGAAIRVGSGHRRRAQWRRPAAARSRSASARGRSAPLGLEPPPHASIHAVAIVGGGREETHAAWPRSVVDRPQSTPTNTEERLHLQHGAGGGHHLGHAYERAAVEVGVEEGTDEVIPHGDGAEDLRGRERRVEKGVGVEPGTAPSSPLSNREREEPPLTKTVWLSWKFHCRRRGCTKLCPSTVRERERIRTPHGDKAAPAWG